MSKFYHIKNLQSTKTDKVFRFRTDGFITLRIYKVLKQEQRMKRLSLVLSH